MEPLKSQFDVNGSITKFATFFQKMRFVRIFKNRFLPQNKTIQLPKSLQNETFEVDIPYIFDYINFNITLVRVWSLWLKKFKFPYLVSLLNQFHGAGVFLYSLKILRKPGICWCLLGIERNQRHKIGEWFSSSKLSVRWFSYIKTFLILEIPLLICFISTLFDPRTLSNNFFVSWLEYLKKVAYSIKVYL